MGGVRAVEGAWLRTESVRMEWRGGDMIRVRLVCGEVDTRMRDKDEETGLGWMLWFSVC